MSRSRKSLSENAFKVEEYDGHKYDNLYFDSTFFYTFENGKYKRVQEWPDFWGAYVKVNDVDGTMTSIKVGHFMRDNNLLNMPKPPETLSEQAVKVDEYDDHKYENLYFDQDHFYKWNGSAYKCKYEFLHKNGVYVKEKDVNGVWIPISISKFKRDNNL